VFSLTKKTWRATVVLEESSLGYQRIIEPTIETMNFSLRADHHGTGREQSVRARGCCKEQKTQTPLLAGAAVFI
jgi:hypothetical protein